MFKHQYLNYIRILHIYIPYLYMDIFVNFYKWNILKLMNEN